MFRRARAPRVPVTFRVDGREVVAEEGEPIAVALLASGRVALARGPKVHRPRGPACMRGGCDGCLMRVDGEPNVMTCVRPARTGQVVETQNVLGSASTDLLRGADMVFPHGIDHHHLLAGIPVLGQVMQVTARRLAGLGHLPSEVRGAEELTRMAPDVLVVGGGAAGLAMVASLRGRGLDVCLVDEGVRLGGALLGLSEHAAAIEPAPALEGVTLLGRHTVAGLYEGEALVIGEGGATLVAPRAIVLATGAHEPAVAVPNNDLPGVMSARALCRLLDAGLEPSGRVALLDPEGPHAEELARRLGDGLLAIPAAKMRAIHGLGRVRSIAYEDEGGAHRERVVIVAVGGAPAPSFELAAQAGARVVLTGAGYAVQTGACGRVQGAGAALLYALGEVTGAPLAPARFLADARAIADDLLTRLG